MLVQPCHRRFTTFQTVLQNATIFLADDAEFGLDRSPRHFKVAFAFAHDVAFEAGEFQHMNLCPGFPARQHEAAGIPRPILAKHFDHIEGAHLARDMRPVGRNLQIVFGCAGLGDDVPVGARETAFLDSVFADRGCVMKLLRER